MKAHNISVQVSILMAEMCGGKTNKHSIARE